MKKLAFKAGVILSAAHLRPHMTEILRVALLTAPDLTDGTVTVTEANRDIRDSLDFHELNLAFDLRCKNIVASDQPDREARGHSWAEAMKQQLGEEYDIIAHGSGDSFHIHAEFDTRF